MLNASEYRKLMHRKGAFNNYNYNVCSVLNMTECRTHKNDDDLCEWNESKSICEPNKGGYKTSSGDFSYIPLKNDSDIASVCPFFEYNDHDCPVKDEKNVKKP